MWLSDYTERTEGKLVANWNKYNGYFHSISLESILPYFKGKLNEYNEMSLMKTQFSLFNMQADGGLVGVLPFQCAVPTTFSPDQPSLFSHRHAEFR